MERTRKAGKPAKRGQRGSAAWGRRLAALALMLVGGMGFAQSGDMTERAQLSPRIASELNHQLTQARQGLGGNKNVQVIVQYKQAPQKETLGRLQKNGGRLGAKLDLIKGASFSVPVNALAALENDPEVEFVSVDHPVKGMDDAAVDDLCFSKVMQFKL